MKRFRDTNITREPWYRRLSPVYKCAWDFLCDECDAAGVWTIDVDAMTFYIGEEVNLQKFMEVVNADKKRVEFFGKDKIFIPGFIEFQYGTLSENCKPHQKIIALLQKYKIWDKDLGRVPDRVPDRVSDTLQEEEEEEEEDKDKEEEVPARAKPKRKQSATPGLAIHNQDPELFAEYKRKIEEASKMDNRSAWIVLKDFLIEKTPQFIEPYVDLWNLFAHNYGLSKVAAITQKRRDKFKVRIREQEFNFLAILEGIRSNDFYLGKSGNSGNSWKADFDFILESQDRYIKILERR